MHLSLETLTRIGRAFGLEHAPIRSYPLRWVVPGTERSVLIVWSPQSPSWFGVRLYTILADGNRRYEHDGDFVVEPGETSGAEETLGRLLGWAATRGYGSAEVAHV